MSNNFWGCLIASLRQEQKVSQRQLAARARVNRSTLRRIEDGTARGDIDIMERLLKYLGYELEAMSASSVEERIKAQAQIETNPDKRSKLAVQRLLSMSVVNLT
jgi:transcriptional regulator with XRE-family HTH domain